MVGGERRRRYRILELIGRGGFGVVYRAELLGAEGFTKQVALKVLRGPEPKLGHSAAHSRTGRRSAARSVAPAASDPAVEAFARLRDEARRLGLVHHRVLLSVDGLVSLGGRWAMVMEFIDGASLDELSSSGPLPLPIALQIVEEVAQGLHAAHTARGPDGRPLRLLHRDIKPSNIRLTPHGEVKLLDFGVARAELGSHAPEPDHAVPRGSDTASELVGTRPWLAPERLDLECSPKSDVYSLVLTLAVLLTAVPPSAASVDPDRHRALVEELCGRLRAAGAPEPLCALVQRGLAWNPDDRPDARELERALRAIRTALPDQPLSEWAEQHVRLRMADADRTLQDDPWVGQELVEDLGVAEPPDPQTPSAARSPRSVIPAPASLSPRPAPSLPPRPAPSLGGQGPISVYGPTPLLPVEPPPRKRRWVWLGLIGVLLGLVLSAAAALSAALGGTAMLGALLMASMSDPIESCLSTVRNTRQDLVRSQVKGMRKAAPVFERALQDCKDEKLGFWGAIVVMNVMREKSADGSLEDSDLDEVEAQLDLFEGR